MKYPKLIGGIAEWKDGLRLPIPVNCIASCRAWSDEQWTAWREDYRDPLPATEPAKVEYCRSDEMGYEYQDLVDFATGREWEK